MGSTGSIGTSALDVVRQANARDAGTFHIQALCAGSDAETLAKQAIEFGAKAAIIADETQYETLKDLLNGHPVEVAAGTSAVTEAATRPSDLVVAAIVGAAGLESTLAAVSEGIDVAIANKESVVCGGQLILSRARQTGAKILPVDSEHNAIFQLIQSDQQPEKLTITASGGPFLRSSKEQMSVATPAEAAAHPNWDMGIKNSIDSATLMNKALEYIEAAFLFDMPASKLDVLVHPQSIVHGMAHFNDGSVLAQLSSPDMRAPISYALGWPDRIETNVPRLDLAELGRLDFEPVDEQRFPAIRLAQEAIRVGNSATTVLNCSNEAAVSAFIAGQCGFLDISWVVEKVLSRFDAENMTAMTCDSVEEIAYLDRYGRRMAEELLQDAPSRAGG